jgi:hypothetical protein
MVLSIGALVLKADNSYLFGFSSFSSNLQCHDLLDPELLKEGYDLFHRRLNQD